MSRDERLRREHQLLEHYLAQCPRDADDRRLVEILETQGDPPIWYRLNFRCKGLVKDSQTGLIGVAINHQVEVRVGPEFPATAPGVVVVTPVYHPNIGDGSHGGYVCFAELVQPETSLAEIVRQVGEMIRLAVFWKHPLTRTVYQDLQRKSDLLPVDTRAFPAVAGLPKGRSLPPPTVPWIKPSAQAAPGHGTVQTQLDGAVQANRGVFDYWMVSSTDEGHVIHLVLDIETFALVLAASGKQTVVRTRHNEARLQVPTLGVQQPVLLTWLTPIFHPYLEHNLTLQIPETSGQVNMRSILAWLFGLLAYRPAQGLAVCNPQALNWVEQHAASVEWLRQHNPALQLSLTSAEVF